jgi:hypothetical protein
LDVKDDVHVYMEYNTNLHKNVCINSSKMRKLKGEGRQVEAGGLDRSCMEWEVLRNTLICQKDVGRGSGSMGRAINSVKNAKMKRVGAG